MFQGLTIEELIKSVERAEQHAREQQRAKMDFQNDPVRGNPAGGDWATKYRELVEVA